MELSKRVSSSSQAALRTPMARRGVGKKGQRIQLLTNHIKAKVAKTDGYFFQYSVSITYEDGNPVDAKGIGRKLVDKVWETYKHELSGKDFAYDGEKSLFTFGSLPGNLLDFTVVIEEVNSNRNAGNGSPEGDDSPDTSDTKRLRRQQRSKTYKVAISYATKVSILAIVNALNGIESDKFQEADRDL